MPQEALWTVTHGTLLSVLIQILVNLVHAIPPICMCRTVSYLQSLEQQLVLENSSDIQ